MILTHKGPIGGADGAGFASYSYDDQLPLGSSSSSDAGGSVAGDSAARSVPPARRYFVLDIVFSRWRVGWGVSVGLVGESLQVTTVQEALASQVEKGQGKGSHRGKAQAKRGQIVVEMSLGPPQHGGRGYGEFEVPHNAVRIRGRGEVQ